MFQCPHRWCPPKIVHVSWCWGVTARLACLDGFQQVTPACLHHPEVPNVSHEKDEKWVKSGCEGAQPCCDRETMWSWVACSLTGTSCLTFHSVSTIEQKQTKQLWVFGGAVKCAACLTDATSFHQLSVGASYGIFSSAWSLLPYVLLLVVILCLLATFCCLHSVQLLKALQTFG